ncbi:hypothetical protein Slin15195_G005890 [Septoria linicola]|uniref:Uncharacterized protein n=1 Tax=Septoria linicola TaxID=215465 RepID=A0A9Q9ADS8_9PEZI|nr:hypothetical protein Slin14017_G005920 [Septoria linicola]USW47270.1 hypothetical protein Slin15195_G005890 [Septoria linicola]
MKITNYLLPGLGVVSVATAGVYQRQAQEQSTSISAPSGSSSTSATTPTTSPSPTTSVSSTEQNSDTGITGSGSDVDSEAGASGSQAGSFSLSKGGLIAIIVVVAFVAVFGIASTVLWVLAKRRQWNIRQSIKRASRRFTGRAARDATRDRQSKRAGLQMSHIPAQRGHKGGIDVRVKDAEKGTTNKPIGDEKSTKQQSGWTEKLWRNDWQK